MISLSTEVDLIRHIYGETSEIESATIETALKCDVELEEQYFDFKLDTEFLNRISFEPSRFSLKKVFDYSIGLSINEESS